MLAILVGCNGLGGGSAELVGKGLLAGYSILGAVLIDGHRPQADTVRDFITAQSGRG